MNGRVTPAVAVPAEGTGFEGLKGLRELLDAMPAQACACWPPLSPPIPFDQPLEVGEAFGGLVARADLDAVIKHVGSGKVR